MMMSGALRSVYRHNATTTALPPLISVALSRTQKTVSIVPSQQSCAFFSSPSRRNLLLSSSPCKTPPPPPPGSSPSSSIYRMQLRFASSSSKQVHKTNWKPEVVYLYQFKRSPVVPNLSPFCLKLETWLRTNNIDYEVCESWMQRSSEGLLPFVELNGEPIADSQIIIMRLQKHFKVQDKVKGMDRGAARAVDRMLEGNTFYALLYSKVMENAANMLNSNVSGLPIPAFLTNFVGSKFADKIRKRLKAQGMAKHSREDVINILRCDIQAVDDLLGDKKFLFGDTPSTADCTLFGHLATTYYLPYRQPITDLLDDEFPRVKAHLERMRTHYFPEWKHEH